MGCKFVRIGDVATFRKESVKPEAGVIYYCYSFPAFDNVCTPEVMDGSKILSSKFRFVAGDILVNKLNMRFKRIWPIGDQLAPNSVCSTEFIPLTPNENVDRNFLLYVLLSDSFTRKLSGMRTGTSGSHQRVKVDWILDYEFMLPDFTTQRKIGDILATIDAKIALNGRINDYLSEIASALFSHEILESIDDTWLRASLLDIASYKNGLAMQKYRPEKDDPGLPVLKIKELAQGQCAADAERCRSGIDESVKVFDGDLIFSWSGTLLLDFWAGGNAGLNQHLFKVTSKKYKQWFYYFWTNYHMRKFITLAKDRATTMGHIKRSALAESEVYIPNENKMNELDKLFDPLIKKIISLKIESRILSELRNELLPKLMSGEIDVCKVGVLVERL